MRIFNNSAYRKCSWNWNCQLYVKILYNRTESLLHFGSQMGRIIALECQQAGGSFSICSWAPPHGRIEFKLTMNKIQVKGFHIKYESYCMTHKSDVIIQSSQPTSTSLVSKWWKFLFIYEWRKIRIFDQKVLKKLIKLAE